MVREIHNFVMCKLRQYIIEDIKNFRIFNESDFENCVYFHLRNFLPKKRVKNRLWIVRTEPRMGIEDINPDIGIHEGYSPRIILELKVDWERHIAPGKIEHDREKIKKLKKIYPKLSKAYFLGIYNYDSEWIDKQESILKGKKWEKNFLFEWYINFDDIKDSMEPGWGARWEEYRDIGKKYMQKRKNE